MEQGTSDYTSWSSDDDDDLCNLQPHPAEVLSQTYIHSIICAFGLIGNVLVMVTYGFYKRTKTMTDVYLFNVAVADLIFVVALPLIIYNEQNKWSMGSAACKILRSAYSINLYSGMLLLACISGDRYVAIVQARRSFGSRTHNVKYSRLICSGIWMFAVVLTLPTFIYTELLEEKNYPVHHTGLLESNFSVSSTGLFKENNNTEFFEGNDHPVTQTGPFEENNYNGLFEEDFNDTSEEQQALSVTCQLTFNDPNTAKLIKVMVPSLQMVIGFLLPFLLMVFCYSCIVWTLLRATSSQKHKAIKVVLAVVLVFFLCHLPYNITLLIHTTALFKQRSCAAEKMKLQVLAASRSVAYLHCCLNPFLYAFIGVTFRSHFKKILSDFWCFSKKYIHSSRLSRGASDICISGVRPSDGSNMSSFTA